MSIPELAREQIVLDTLKVSEFTAPQLTSFLEHHRAAVKSPPVKPTKVQLVFFIAKSRQLTYDLLANMQAKKILCGAPTPKGKLCGKKVSQVGQLCINHRHSDLVSSSTPPSSTKPSKMGTIANKPKLDQSSNPSKDLPLWAQTMEHPHEENSFHKSPKSRTWTLPHSQDIEYENKKSNSSRGLDNRSDWACQECHTLNPEGYTRCSNCRSSHSSSSSSSGSSTSSSINSSHSNHLSGGSFSSIDSKRQGTPFTKEFKSDSRPLLEIQPEIQPKIKSEPSQDSVKVEPRLPRLAAPPTLLPTPPTSATRTPYPSLYPSLDSFVESKKESQKESKKESKKELKKEFNQDDGTSDEEGEEDDDISPGIPAPDMPPCRSNGKCAARTKKNLLCTKQVSTKFSFKSSLCTGHLKMIMN